MHAFLIFTMTLISSTIFASTPPRIGNIKKAQSCDSGLTSKKSATTTIMSLFPTRASDLDIPVVPVVTRTRTPKVHAKRKPKAFSSEDLTSKVHTETRQPSSSPKTSPKTPPKLGHTRKRSYSDTMPPMRATTTSHTTQKPHPLIKASSTGEVQKRVTFTISPKQVRRIPQTQKARQPLDETRLRDNKSTLIAIMKQRVPLKQHDYTYESCVAWRNEKNDNIECIQLLVAKKEEQKEEHVEANNDKEEHVEWNTLPYIAFLHTFQKTTPFDMSTPLAKIRHKGECIYLTEVFPMLLFPGKSFFKKKYTVEAHYNEDTNSFDLVVLRRYIIPSNYERTSKKKQASPEEQTIKIKKEIADEQSKARREFFKNEKDLLAKIEVGIEKQKEKNKLLDSMVQ